MTPIRPAQKKSSPKSSDHNLQQKLAQSIAAQPPLAAQAIKASVKHAVDSKLPEGLAFERQAFFRLFDTQDQKEGMAAFAEKRKPVWTGK